MIWLQFSLWKLLLNTVMYSLAKMNSFLHFPLRVKYIWVCLPIYHFLFSILICFCCCWFSLLLLLFLVHNHNYCLGVLVATLGAEYLVSVWPREYCCYLQSRLVELVPAIGGTGSLETVLLYSFRIVTKLEYRVKYHFLSNFWWPNCLSPHSLLISYSYCWLIMYI